MRHWRLAVLILLGLPLAWWLTVPRMNPSRAVAAERNAPIAQLRRPVALALADADRLLFVANRRSGSVSVLDSEKQRVIHEQPIAKKLADFTLTADGRHALALDESTHELLLFSRSGPKLTLAARTAVGQYPVNVRVRRDGSQCYVTSLWSRRLTIVDLTLPADGPEKAGLAVKQSVDLPFAPRMQLLVKGDAKLLVADSFGGQIAVVDPRQGKIERIRKLPAHNIRGMALSPDGRRLLISHQILNDLAETSHNDVHCGVLMSNVLRWVVLDRVLGGDALAGDALAGDALAGDALAGDALAGDALAGDGQILKDSHVHMTGDTQSAGADPAGVTVTADGRAVIALGGVNEVGFGHERDYSLRRMAVGRRPTAVVARRDGRRAYVANTFGDSVSVVDLAEAKVLCEIPLGPPAKLTAADRGEMLFYNGRLSLDGWMSCHSCHTDGHTNGLLNDNLGDNSFGAPKRVLSLLGVGDTKPWAWNGQVTDLETQIEKSVKTTMRGRQPSADDVRALAAYLKTLRPPPPLSKVRKIDAESIARGRTVFERHDCGRCHRAPTYTSAGRYDVDLADTAGNRQFNPPSLRGVSQRGPYFHDSRAASLQSVFAKHRHGLAGELTEQQLADLMAFLQSL